MDKVTINKTDLKNLIGYIDTVLDLVDTESMEYEKAEIIVDGYDDFVKPIVEAIEEIEEVDKYNEMLRKAHGESITVQLKKRIDEDDGSEYYYYTSAKYGESDNYKTIKEAYEEADSYLRGVGELW